MPSPDNSNASRTAWLMLISSFALSQAFRTTASIMAPSLAQTFSLSPQQLGLFAAAFHFSFAGLQLFMGMAIDVYGPRRTIVAVFPLAIAGSLVMALAPSYRVLVAGQILTGIGCGPALLVCTVLSPATSRLAALPPSTARRWASARSACCSRPPPLAWTIEATSWRAGFVALAGIEAMAWAAIFFSCATTAWQPMRHDRT